MTGLNLSRTLCPFLVARSVLAFAACFVLTAAAHSQIFSVVYNFGQNNTDPYDGVEYAYPGILAQGRDGNIYGTALSGGAFGNGGVFSITPSGTLRTLHSFNSTDGMNPFSGLTLGTDGSFYGGTAYGGSTGNGVVFKVSPTGKFTLLYNFTGGSGGSAAAAPPILGTDGNFYGTTASEYGTFYKMTPSGKLTTLFQGNGSVIGSVAPLVQGTDGNFYDTSRNTVFKVTPVGKFTRFHSFSTTDGADLVGPLVQGTDGNFYGTAMSGGTYGGGTVFKITSSGTLTVLHSFNIGSGSTDGNQPTAGLVQATDGNFYGVTQTSGGSAAGSPGTIFKITSSGVYSQLYVFASQGTGTYPATTLIQHTNGKLYGHTPLSGAFNTGTLFSFDVGLAPFVSLIPASGKVGKTIGVLGQGFVGTTGVSFNGIFATSFTVVSDTYMTAVVPSGTTTGPVVVVTPTETLTSNKSFRICQ